MALRQDQRGAQGQVHLQLVLGARRRIRQRPEQGQRPGEVAHGLHIGGARDGALACPLPIGEGLRPQACRRIMLGHQLRLARGCVGHVLL
jgi:hypothetical protein